VGRDRTVNKDEMAEYKSRMEVGVLGQLGSEGDDSDVDALRRMENVEEIASLEQRWGSSWTTSLKTRCAPC
jgi:dynactin-4